MWGKDFLSRQIKRAARKSGPSSWRNAFRSVELIVHAGPQDVVGDVRTVADDEIVPGRRHDVRGERSRDGSEICAEIFDLARPMSQEDSFDAAADGPSKLDGAVAQTAAARHDRDAIDALRADQACAADIVGDADFAIGQAAGQVSEGRWVDSWADATAKRAEPFELLAQAVGYRERGHVEWGRVADMSPCASSIQDRGRAAGAHDGRTASLARAL